jgi:hypothetical protein
MVLFALLIKLINIPVAPMAQVETPIAEIEAVFVPAGFEGPIVAAPFNEIVF